MKNIATFTGFVIPMLFAAAVVAAGDGIRPFLTFGSDVLAAKAADVEAQPQLRAAGEIGAAFPFPGQLRPSLALGGFYVESSIPANSILYRSYYGAHLSATLDIRGDGGTAPFFSFGGSCALARYRWTDLYFLAYAVQVAPGLSIERERLELRLSAPLRAEFRGDGRSLSAGLALTIAKPPRQWKAASR